MSTTQIREVVEALRRSGGQLENRAANTIELLCMVFLGHKP